MKHTCHLTTVLAILLLPGTDGSACGPWFPRRYLENGGKELLQTPQFFAELELKLLAREYPVPFAAVRDAHPVKSTGERDLQDFDAALLA